MPSICASILKPRHIFSQDCCMLCRAWAYIGWSVYIVICRQWTSIYFAT